MIEQSEREGAKDVRDLLRGRQVHAAEDNVGKALSGYLVAVIFTSVLIHTICGPIVFVWLAVSLAFCIPRIAHAFKISRRPPECLSRQDVHIYIILSVIASLAMATIPLWIIARSEGFVFAYMLSFVIGVFVFGCFVHAPVFGSAAAYMVTQFVIAVMCYASTGLSLESMALTLEFTCMTATAFLVIRQHSALFARNVLQQVDLEQKSADLQRQADVIGLLLKEHEDQSSDWLWRIDGTGQVREPSQRFSQVCQMPDGMLNGMPIGRLLAAPDLDGNREALAVIAANIDNRRSFRDVAVPLLVGGQPRWWSISGRPVHDDKSTFAGFRGVMADLTGAKAAEARVVHLANHDPLTDLPNRAYFREQLGRGLRQADQGGLALISIDLDNFKPVNDRHGHAFGDQVLVVIAERLREPRRRGDSWPAAAATNSRS